MHTLFDFVTHIKTVEYLIAVSAIAVFIIYWEILKPRPFRTLVQTSKEDVEHIRKTGYRNTVKSIGMVAAAPFIGLAYLIALPFAFLYALGSAAVRGVASLAGGTATFGWRPTEAYFGGKKKKEKEEKEESATGKEE